MRITLPPFPRTRESMRLKIPRGGKPRHCPTALGLFNYPDSYVCGNDKLVYCCIQSGAYNNDQRYIVGRVLTRHVGPSPTYQGLRISAVKNATRH